MNKRPPLIALLTDFGASDGYVGAMRGVIHTLSPHAHIADISHDITPQDLRQAAYVLLTTCPYFPRQTIFAAVVDPGVGTARRAIAAACVHGVFVGPDNGVFSYVFAGNPVVTAVEITNPAYTLKQHSNTFHGRDVFAPAAAHLANGVGLSELGPTITRYETIPQPNMQITAGQVVGEIIYIDRFGNAVTSIGSLAWNKNTHLTLVPRFGQAQRIHPTRIPASARISIGSMMLHRVRMSYGTVMPGQPLALINSAGQLEVAVNQGNAAQMLGLSVGDEVRVRLK